MKKLLFMGIMLISLFASMAAAAERPAAFSFVIPSPVVYDVPFSVQLQVDTDGFNFIDYDLSTGTSDGSATFSGVTRADQFQLVSVLSGLQDGGAYYRVRTETNGGVFSASSARTLLTYNDVKISGIGEGGTTFVLQTVPLRTVTSDTAGDTFAISSNSASVTALLSRCGDSVVGYEDINSDGIKQQTESQEACDDGNTVGGDGCAADCRYIDLGYSCTFTNFGGRDGRCTPLNPVDYALVRITAILKQQCYPLMSQAPTFPNNLRYNCEDDGVSARAITSRLKYQLIGGVLLELFQ